MRAPALEHCANCDEAIGRLEPAHLWNDQVVCARCYRKLNGTAQVPPTAPVAPALAPPAVAPAVWVPPSARPDPTVAGEERVFYSDRAITITRSRVIYQGETIALANVSSVSVWTIEPDYTATIWSVVIGLGFVLLGLLVLAGDAKSDLETMAAMFVVLGAALTVVGIYFGGKLKPSYAMNVVTNAGERRISPHRKKQYIFRLVQAVNEAIAAR